MHGIRHFFTMGEHINGDVDSLIFSAAIPTLEVDINSPPLPPDSMLFLLNHMQIPTLIRGGGGAKSFAAENSVPINMLSHSKN